MSDSFTAQDVRGIIMCLCLYPLLLVPPGYVFCWAANLFAFRQRAPICRLLLSVATSLALCPILTYLIIRSLSLPVVWVVYAVALAMALALIFSHIAAFSFSRLPTALWHDRVLRSALLVGGTWTTVALLSLIDVQIGKHLYLSVTTGDYQARVAVTDAILRGVPPSNPSFFPGHPVRLYYYYLWSLICSLVASLTSSLASTRQAVFAGTIWSGFSMLSVLALYFKFVIPREPRCVPRRVMMGVGLLLVSGVDFVPVLLSTLRSYIVGPGLLPETLEAWNEQILGWVSSALWVPHHLAGLASCLVALLVLLGHPEQHPGGRIGPSRLVLGGFALASGFGLSIWVALVFAAFFGTWLVISLWRGDKRESYAVLLMGVVAALLVVPFALDLASANEQSGFPIELAVRQFTPAVQILSHYGLSNPFLTGVIDSLLLPLNYTVELGFFLLASIFYWTARHRLAKPVAKNDLALCTLCLVSILIPSLFRSRFGTNDLGWRGFLPAQFVMLLWSADVLSEFMVGWRGAVGFWVRGRLRSWIRAILAALLVTGVLTTLADLTLLRTFSFFAEQGVTKTEGDSFLYGGNGLRIYALRQAYEWLADHLPANAVLAQNPNTDREMFSGLYGGRQVAAADRKQGPLYGIPVQNFLAIASPIETIFERGANLSDVDAVCRRFSIDVLVVKDVDPVWRHTYQWASQRTPLLANGFVRAFQCDRTKSSTSGE